MKPPEVAENRMMPLPLGVLEHDLGITQNSADRRLEFLAHVCEKHPVKAVVFGARLIRFRHCRSISPIMGIGETSTTKRPGGEFNTCR